MTVWVIAVAILFVGAALFAISEEFRAFVYYGLAGSTYGVTSGDDVNEAAGLQAAVAPAITAIHHFSQNSAVQPKEPPIGVIPGSRGLMFTQPPLVKVYEIRDRGEQDRVIAAVRDVVRDRKLRAVDVRFMDHENWIVHGNVGERGPEVQLRRVRISQESVREEGGAKTIKYRY